ncbi:hypothetical protein FA95DRAFT_946044 [Auriscalpium vulgare]|uniref:Uncharacterized protein n=1 Tax=Auriscalpium vulgare TaxID=40419 RepID=A0ACB8S9T2_9AGAM|nr:hypothetical protein FA95DRAFT_946044 [Auriscalpium vulgare]
MAEDPQLLPVRVWYTVDGSPQYILARSVDKFPVNPISAPGPSRIANITGGDGPPAYATTSLKACLHTMCRSSPELMHYGSRDYSLYVLDPTESESAPSSMVMDSQEATPRPSQGVAVGMGLMSWALAAPDDGVSVTGTLVKVNSGDRALEVIFALRGAPVVQQPMYYQNGGNPWQMHMPGALPMHGFPGQAPGPGAPLPAPVHALPAPQATPAHISPYRSSSPAPTITEKRQFAKAADFPLPYIGPPKKSRRASAKIPASKTKEHPLVRAPLSFGPRDVKLPKVESRQRELISQPVASSSSTPALDLNNPAVRAALTCLISSYATPANPVAPQASTIPPAAVNALVQLLTHPSTAAAAAPASAPTETASDFAPTPASSQTSTAQETSDADADDEIVVLEKENVNPAAFGRRSASRATDEEEPAPQPARTHAHHTSRKRRLSEVAEGRGAPSKRRCESSPAPAPVRKLNFISRPLQSEPGGPLVVASERRHMEPAQTKAPAPGLSRLNADLFAARSALVASTSTTFAISQAGGAKPSTPPKSSSPAKRAKKPYVVPEWARTTTATKPRYSADAIARMAQESAEREEERKRARARRPARAAENGSEDAARASEGPAQVFTAPRAAASVARPVRPPAPAVASAAPITAAAADIIFPRSSSPAPSPSKSAPQQTPRTPRRVKRSERSVLPTPAADATSPLFSPDADADTAPPKQMSPIQRVLAGRGIAFPSSPLQHRTRKSPLKTPRKDRTPNDDADEKFRMSDFVVSSSDGDGDGDVQAGEGAGGMEDLKALFDTTWSKEDQAAFEEMLMDAGGREDGCFV